MTKVLVTYVFSRVVPGAKNPLGSSSRQDMVGEVTEQRVEDVAFEKDETEEEKYFSQIPSPAAPAASRTASEAA